MTIYKTWDVIEVPFPFIESDKTKRRKALVLSNREYCVKNNACILVMITSAENSSWFGDVPISEHDKAGLNKPCVVRFKLFTLDKNLITKKIGTLNARDQKAVQTQLNSFLR